MREELAADSVAAGGDGLVQGAGGDGALDAEGLVDARVGEEVEEGEGVGADGAVWCE